MRLANKYYAVSDDNIEQDAVIHRSSLIMNISIKDLDKDYS